MHDLIQFVEVPLYLVFNLTSFGTLKHDCVIITIEIFNFLFLLESLVTTGFSFLLLIMSAIIPSKAIKTSQFFPRLYSSILF